MTTLPTAFERKTMESTCIVWVGAVNSLGYGVVQIDGDLQLAHRVAYETERGPLPDGLVLDHLCRVRNCVKVEHLEPVTQAENIRRGRRARSLAVGDECSNGHLIGEGDLYERPSGKTECMECRRVGKRANRAGAGRPTVQRHAARVRADVEQADLRSSA